MNYKEITNDECLCTSNVTCIKEMVKEREMTNWMQIFKF